MPKLKEKLDSDGLPFVDSIFEPGFPSRMTIKMMIEFMAGKSGSIYGTTHDATLAINCKKLVTVTMELNLCIVVLMDDN